MIFKKCSVFRDWFYLQIRYIITNFSLSSLRHRKLLKSFSLLYFTLICVSCAEEQAREIIEQLKVSDAFQNGEKVLASNIVSQIEYIRLETSSDNVIKGYPSAYIVNDKLILLKSYRRISLFNRSTGEFLKDIGNASRDPEGYASSLIPLGLSRDKELVYAKGWRGDLHQYALSNGKLVRKIPKPHANAAAVAFTEDISPVSAYGVLNDDYLAGFISNSTGNEKLRLILYDYEGQVKKLIYNGQSYTNDRSRVVYNSAEGMFYNFNNSLFFKEYFSDTLFQLSLDTLIPRYYFDLGKYSPPYDKRLEALSHSMADYMFVRGMFESDQFVFFRIGFRNRQHMAYYKKNSKKMRVSNIQGLEWSGFENDVDNFVPFFPDKISENNQIVGTLSAEHVYEWFQNNPDKIASLPERLRSFRDIQPEDNPIVMIAKFK